MISDIENIPFGQGPKKRIGIELSKISEKIKSGKGIGIIFVETNFPAVIYKLMAQMGWRRAIRKNGLKVKDLARRLT